MNKTRLIYHRIDEKCLLPSPFMNMRIVMMIMWCQIRWTLAKV